MSMLGIMAIGCDSGQIPTNAILAVSPQSRTFEVLHADAARCISSDNYYQDIPLLFSLITAEGSPIGEAELTIIADFTESTFSGFPVIRLYDDRNSNGVVDEETELVSGPNNLGFVTQTSRYGGERLVWARVNLSCPFSAEVFAYSGTVSTSARIVVNALGADEPVDDEPDDQLEPDDTSDPDYDLPTGPVQ